MVETFREIFFEPEEAKMEIEEINASDECLWVWLFFQGLFFFLQAKLGDFFIHSMQL